MPWFLDNFALAGLLIFVIAAMAIWVLLGIMPGRIARDRNHPQADAISVCGWWDVLTKGLLLPLAYIIGLAVPMQWAHPLDRSRSSDM